MGPGYELRTPKSSLAGLPQASFLTQRADRLEVAVHGERSQLCVGASDDRAGGPGYIVRGIEGQPHVRLGGTGSRRGRGSGV
jgi:hypothetical protein